MVVLFVNMIVKWNINKYKEVLLLLPEFKEKLLAALRGGIKTVLIPEENEKDLAEIPDNVKDGLKIIPVSHVSEVLKLVLVEEPKAVEWDEAAEAAAALAKGEGAGATAH